MANIILAGTPSTTVLVAETLTKAEHIIQTVVCPFPKPVGRKGIITPCALQIWAETHAIPVLNVDREILQSQNTLSLPQTDLLIVADFGFLVPAWLLNFPKYGAINIHPSLLPRWRGASPVPFTLLFGDTKTGVTLIKMNEKFDQGAVVAQQEVSILPTDTTPTLLIRAFEIGANLLVETLPSYLSGEILMIPQPKDSPTPKTTKFTKEDGYIPFTSLQDSLQGKITSEPIPLLARYNLSSTSQGIDRMVRALTPWPGTWTLLPSGQRMKILETSVDGLILEIRKIQKEGKNPQIWHANLA